MFFSSLLYARSDTVVLGNRSVSFSLCASGHRGCGEEIHHWWLIKQSKVVGSLDIFIAFMEEILSKLKFLPYQEDSAVSSCTTSKSWALLGISQNSLPCQRWLWVKKNLPKKTCLVKGKIDQNLWSPRFSFWPTAKSSTSHGLLSLLVKNIILMFYTYIHTYIHCMQASVFDLFSIREGIFPLHFHVSLGSPQEGPGKICSLASLPGPSEGFFDTQT